MQVTLSYRSAAFTRAKVKNRDKVMAMAADRRLRILFNSNVKEIHDHAVVIQQGDTTGSIRNDAVIISAGGILPSGFLREVGIAVETKYGTA